jgi:hypothetical protein
MTDTAECVCLSVKTYRPSVTYKLYSYTDRHAMLHQHIKQKVQHRQSSALVTNNTYYTTQKQYLDAQWGHWTFSIFLNFLAVAWPWGYSTCKRYDYQKIFLEGKAWPVTEAQPIRRLRACCQGNFWFPTSRYISWPYRPPRSIVGITFIYFSFYIVSCWRRRSQSWGKVGCSSVEGRPPLRLWQEYSSSDLPRQCHFRLCQYDTQDPQLCKYQCAGNIVSYAIVTKSVLLKLMWFVWNRKFDPQNDGTFQNLDLPPSHMREASTLLGPLERVNLNNWTVRCIHSSCCVAWLFNDCS